MCNTTAMLPSSSHKVVVAGVFRVSFRRTHTHTQRERERVCVCDIKISRGEIFWHVRFLFPLLGKTHSEIFCLDESKMFIMRKT